MVNASPDLPAQIQGFSELNPSLKPRRNTPISGVLLTNADLDHLLGLFLLREGSELNVFATAAVRSTAEDSLGLETVLNSFCGSKWHEPPVSDFARLDQSKDPSPGLYYRAIELPGKPPRFASRTRSAGPDGQSVAYQFFDSRTKGRLLVAPDVAAVNPQLVDCLNSSDVVLFDGTFWAAGELQEVRPGAQKAADMGHMTIQDGSLKLLAGLRARQKVYIHINNTNPILAAGSPERAAVEAAGITVGYDGLEFEI